MLIFFIPLGLVAALGIYWLFMSPYSQVFGHFPYRTKTIKKVIALTFDDGPNEPYTSEIVEFLDLKGIKATFFQVGKCIERYPELTKSMAANGHVIGNHSLSHKFSRYLLQPTFGHEIDEAQRVITSAISKTPALFRPPWLWRHPLLFLSLKKRSLRAISGEFCSSTEVLQPSAELMAKHTLAKAKPGGIIIFHDGFDAKGGDRKQTVQAVKIVVDSLLSQGYRFETIDKLLGVPAYQN